ncbi:MAG TPA: hypothetical protein VKR27_07770 [Acidimicrobiales bacterium]|nr:hypothetical protein [Acidimicrobiales bacterium]
MDQTKQHRERTGRLIVGRVATAAFAVAGLSATGLVLSSAGGTTNHTTKRLVISTMKKTGLGTFLVSGKTVYVLTPSKLGCTGSCTTIWPRVLLPKGVAKATAGTGVNAAKLGSVVRSGGARQVTYSGKPLYWFSGDTGTGQTHGNGLKDAWGKWSIDVTVKPTSGTTTTTTGGGGYGY